MRGRGFDLGVSGEAARNQGSRAIKEDEDEEETRRGEGEGIMGG